MRKLLAVILICVLAVGCTESEYKPDTPAPPSKDELVETEIFSILVKSGWENRIFSEGNASIDRADTGGSQIYISATALSYFNFPQKDSRLEVLKYHMAILAELNQELTFELSSFNNMDAIKHTTKEDELESVTYSFIDNTNLYRVIIYSPFLDDVWEMARSFTLNPNAAEAKLNLWGDNWDAELSRLSMNGLK